MWCGDADVNRVTDSWREIMSTEFGGLAPRLASDAQVTGTMQAVVLGTVEAFTISGTPQVLSRSPRAARRNPSESLKLCAVKKGRAVLHQGDRELVVDRGRAVMYDVALPYELSFTDTWSCSVVTFPRHSFVLTPNEIRECLERTYDVRAGSGALLEHFVTTAVAEGADVDPSAATLLGDAGMSLVSAVLTAPETRSAPPSSAVREQILRHVRRNLADPGLSVGSIASALHMSPRTLQRIFADYGHTLSAVIRRERLASVHRDLTNPNLLDRTISSLASRYGFYDAPAFTRAFRAEYGMTPSDARHQALPHTVA